MEIKNGRTLVLVKPDGVQRSLIGEIIRRIERTGLKLVALKFMVPTKELIEKHYLLDPEWMRKAGMKSISAYEKNGKKCPYTDPVEAGRNILNHLQNYLTSGPAAVMIWQGAHAVGVVRKLVGSTEPLSSDVGTIRGDFVIDSYELSDLVGRSIRNLIHASSSPEDAKGEIDLWVDKKDIVDDDF